MSAGEKKSHVSLTIKQRNALAGYGFFLPWIIGFLAFTLYPAVYSIVLSFNQVKISTDGIVTTWKGIAFYDTALRVDTVFPMALGQTVMFIVCATPVIVVFAIIIALLLNGKYRFRTFFRAVFFLPVIIISGPVVSQLLTGKGSMLIQPSENSIYRFIATLPQVLSNPIEYTLSNLVLILWFSGVQIIIFLAGLQKIDRSIYEAASIDGATSWEMFWKVTLPYIRPLILINAIYTIVELANFSNNSVNVKILNHMFEVNRPYSYSAAMSWIYFLTILGLLLVAFLILNDWGSRRKRV